MQKLWIDRVSGTGIVHFIKHTVKTESVRIANWMWDLMGTHLPSFGNGFGFAICNTLKFYKLRSGGARQILSLINTGGTQSR